MRGSTDPLDDARQRPSQHHLRRIEEHLRTVEILLAGVLLKEAPRPELEKLAKLIGVRKAILSELFPQRESKKKNSVSPVQAGTN